MKKVKLSKLLPREIIETGVTDGYCPRQVISGFFQRHSVEKIRVMLFQMEMLAAYGKYEVPIPIETDNEGFFDFRKELEDLCKAVYLDHKYNKKKAIKFVDKGGRHD